MVKKLSILLLLPALSFSQPLRHKHEIVVEKSNIKAEKCVLESVTKCLASVDTKLSVNIVTGKTGDFQYAAIFRLDQASDNSASGKVGGQVWRKINSNVWFGAELATDLDFSLSNEVLIAIDWLNLKHVKSTAYTSINISKNAVAFAGVKFYFNEAITLSLETDIVVDNDKDHRIANEIKIGIGFIVGDDMWKDVENILEKSFGFKLKD